MFSFKILHHRLPEIGFKNSRLLSQLQKNSTQQKTTNELQKKSDIKAQLDAISKEAKDNFLIEFREKKITYDQIFEYKIDEKPHMKSKPLSNSYLSPDFLIKISRRHDLSFNSIKSWIKNKILLDDIKGQQYNVRRHGILGPDLGTAHFICFRGGKVRFKHQPDQWILDEESLPKIFKKNYRLISVDGSNIYLRYEGLDNLILLNELEELHLCNNNLDDFGCDKLARIFRNSQVLSYLDLSGNKDISHRGIEVLHQIRSLKYLVIKNTSAADYPFIDLLILMFQEVLPECEIVYK